MKPIPWSQKHPDCCRLHRTPLDRGFPAPALFFYPSLFFHMMPSHNAVKRSIWYWCLLTDVLLAFAVEILSTNKQKKIKYYNHLVHLLDLSVVLLCFSPHEAQIFFFLSFLFFFNTAKTNSCIWSPRAVYSPHTPRGCRWNEHLSTPILWWELGLLIGPWSRCSAIVTMPFQSW